MGEKNNEESSTTRDPKMDQNPFLLNRHSHISPLILSPNSSRNRRRRTPIRLLIRRPIAVVAHLANLLRASQRLRFSPLAHRYPDRFHYSLRHHILHRRGGYAAAMEAAMFVSSLVLAIGHVVVAYRTSCRERRKLLVYKIDVEAVSLRMQEWIS
ncbi:hypothetical protein DH2020_022307 [Rehmannia glutinosa]|uniref:Uncharacterized protein n=1 Tax=Rehmannia glutinosa TaxID=99300 RepID=A0ABR0WCZ3_REHGL